MSHKISVIAFVAIFLTGATTILAHGDPIIVNAVSGKLTTDKNFYTNVTDTLAIDGALKYSPTSGMFTNNLPGVEIQNNSIVGQLLELDLLPLSPDGTLANARYLWHWNPSDGVAHAPAGTALLVESTRAYPVIPQFDAITVIQDSSNPGTLTIGTMIDTDINTHRHLMQYYLTPTAGLQPGVFGIYAQLQTDMNLPSDPFWMFFNTTEDYLQVAAGTNAIMAAAQTVTVPEPGTIALIAAGLMIKAGWILRKKSISPI